ncbi:hypothetical protein ACP70R_005260 [Stipagrostis hirtigluma subsp. patula]
MKRYLGETGNDGLEAELVEDNASNDNKKDSEGHKAVTNFTQLLTGPMTDDLWIDELF